MKIITYGLPNAVHEALSATIADTLNDLEILRWKPHSDNVQPGLELLASPEVVVVIYVDDLRSVSVLMEAINVAIRAQLKAILVITDIPLDPLLDRGEAGEISAVRSMISERRFAIISAYLEVQENILKFIKGLASR